MDKKSGKPMGYKGVKKKLISVESNYQGGVRSLLEV